MASGLTREHVLRALAELGGPVASARTVLDHLHALGLGQFEATALEASPSRPTEPRAMRRVRDHLADLMRVGLVGKGLRGWYLTEQGRDAVTAPFASPVVVRRLYGDTTGGS